MVKTENVDENGVVDFAGINVFCVGSKRDADWIPGVTHSTFAEAHIVIMPGGSDWNPALYGEKTGFNTRHYYDPDVWQLEHFMRAVQAKKFIIGICRGAQLLGIAAGGRLFQNVSHHAGPDHKIFTKAKRELVINSLHHQMVNWDSIPNINLRGRLIGWSEGISDTYTNGDNRECLTPSGEKYNKLFTIEPEVFYFPTFRGFGIQGHPEMGIKKDTLRFLLRFIKLFYQTSSRYMPIDSIVEDRFELFTEVYPRLKNVFTRQTLSLIKTNINLTSPPLAKRVTLLNAYDEPTIINTTNNSTENCCEIPSKENRSTLFQGTGEW